jgi:hypothetical protein
VSRPAASASLARRVAELLPRCLEVDDDEGLESLALAIHRWQHAHCPTLQRLLATPAERLADIPAVPVALFRELSDSTPTWVGATPPRAAGTVFRTSGTTSGQRGVHRLVDTDLYDRGCLLWAGHHLGTSWSHVLALLSDPAHAPDSSLSHMVALFARKAGAPASWHVHDGTLDTATACQALAAAEGPTLLATTAFALADLLEASPPRLPVGSQMIVTGGFKGRTRTVSDNDLYAAATCRLGATIVTEYGMTELSSQLWGVPGGRYRAPPWMWVTAVDPIRGTPLPPGTSGQLRFLDLCNLDSTLHIETLDHGTVFPDGTLQLHGRLPGATVRGCSLVLDP